MAEAYKGPVQAVIFDWAGTTVDHGCRGPVAVFERAFEHFGLSPTREEIRKPMGMEKRAHCRAMLDMPRLNQQWQAKYGASPAEKDVDAVFAKVWELMPATLADYAEPVPHCVETMAELRSKNIKIGSCTGYSRPMMTELLPRAQKAGYSPDCLVTADEVPTGRPMPWMCWLNCMRLGVFPPQAVVKVGDTITDIKEGLNAGHWTVGVTATSNALGLTAEEAARMDAAELAAAEVPVKADFLAAGAHFVISDLSELPGLCEQISQRLAKGQQP